jgi:outer membrane lipoprotein-sorting protein
MKNIFILASVFVLTSPAYAWFMQPTDFFQTWSAQNKTPQTLLIKQERDLIVDGAVTQTIPETVKIKRPGLYKWTSEIPGLEEMKLLGKSKATMGSPRNQRDVPMKNVLTPIEVVVLYVNAGNIDSVLKQIEIDVKQSKLELISKNKEVRIGDAKGNRLYVSPDTGMLDAMAFQGKLYLIKYNKEKFSMYPSEIEVYENDVLKEKVRTKSVLTNAKISDAEFEVR